MKSFILALSLLSSLYSIAQSPWTQKKGNVYVQLSFTTIPSYSSVYGNPNYSIQGSLTDNSFQLFSEYGLTNNTSLILKIPYKNITSSGLSTPCLTTPCPTSSFTNNALGNIEFGIKHNFYKKKWLVSGQMLVEANTGNYNSMTGLRTGYDAWTFTPLIIAGRGFSKMYVQGFVGANIRTNSYSSNVKLGGELGRKVATKVWLIGFIDIVKSLNNGDIQLPIQNLNNGLYVNNQEYGAFGIKSILELKKNLGITGSLGGAFFGNNVPQQLALTGGIYYKL